MRVSLLCLALLLHASPAFCQHDLKIHYVRLANVDTLVTTYNRYNTQEATISIDKILAKPRLVCDLPDCKVTHFSITFIPRGHDLAGPFSISGAELSSTVKNLLCKYKEEKTNVKIAIEDVQILRNGKTEDIVGGIFYKTW